MDLKKELWDKLTQMEEKKQGKADTYYDILALFNVVGQSEQLPPRCVMDMPASKYCDCSGECKWCENIRR